MCINGSIILTNDGDNVFKAKRGKGKKEENNSEKYWDIAIGAVCLILKHTISQTY